MLKLIYIGDKQSNNFNISCLGKCRFFYEMHFSDGRIYESLRPYLISTGLKLTEKEFDTIFMSDYNRFDLLFASLDTRKIYTVDRIGTIHEFNIALYEKDKKNLIVSEIKETASIPVDITMVSKDKDIADMMEKRGCKIQKSKDGLLFSPPVTLRYNKKFLDELTIKDISEEKTSKGSIEGILFNEKTISITVYDQLTKKTSVCKGKSAYSFKEKRTYVVFNYNGAEAYYEIFYDGKNNNVINDWRAEDHNKLKGKNQSFRIYIWRV